MMREKRESRKGIVTPISNTKFTPLDVDNWNVNYIGGKTFLLTPKSPNNRYIAMTGNNVETLLKIDKNFRLLRITWIHSTATKTTKSEDSLIYSITRYDEDGIPEVEVADTTNAKDASITYEENDGQFPACVLGFNFNTTLNDRIYLKVYVRLSE
jgi:hypothetical protein